MSDEPVDGQDRRLTELLAPIGRMRFPPAATLVGRDYRPRRWIRVVSPMALVGVLVAAVAIVAVRPSGPQTTPTVPTPTAIGQSPLAVILADTWIPLGLDKARAWISFSLDGTYTAFDGCDRLSGRWQVDASVLIVSPPSPPAGECPAKADLFLPGRSSPVAVRRGRLIVGSGADSAQLIPAGAAATTARDGLPLPPADGWLPGYSSFTADRELHDPALAERLAAEIDKRFAEFDRRYRYTGDPLHLWPFVSTQQEVTYLMGYAHKVCTAAVERASGEVGGTGCFDRDPHPNPRKPFAIDEWVFLHDTVRAVTFTDADGATQRLPVRNNAAALPAHDPRKRVVVTITFRDGRSTSFTMGG